MAKKKNLEKFAVSESDERPVRFRKYKYLFLIICEDEKTEPDYFNRFRDKIPKDSIYLETFGTGLKPLGIINKCIMEKEKLKMAARREVDEVWAVFDKDDEDINDTTIKNFTHAFKIAKKEKVKIAYSNEVFELWLLLHFTSIASNVPLSRKVVYNLLEVNIKKIPNFADYNYNHYKPDPLVLNLIEKFGDQSKAIERAEALLFDQKDKDPIDANPSTRVHLLIQELSGWINYFSYDPKGKQNV